MVKEDLIKVIATKTGMTQKDSKEAFKGIFEAIKEVVLEQGESVRTPIGTFSVKEVSPRTGKNNFGANAGEEWSSNGGKKIAYSPSPSARVRY